MPSNKKFAVEVTISELFALSDLIKEVYRDQSYYADKSGDDLLDVTKVNDDGETVTDSRQWMRDSHAKAVAKQAHLSALHETLTGEPLT